MKYFVEYEGNAAHKKEFGAHWNDKYWVIGWIGFGKNTEYRYIIGFQGGKGAEAAANKRAKEMNDGK